MAEPWAPLGGVYELGDFPSGWSDWNDKFRDLMRQGQNKLNVETFTTADLATRHHRLVRPLPKQRPKTLELHQFYLTFMMDSPLPTSIAITMAMELGPKRQS